MQPDLQYKENRTNTRWSWGYLVIILALFFTFSLEHINDPFIHPNEDNNAFYGLSIDNFMRAGFFRLKFGLTGIWLSNESIQKGNINYYTHHPAGFFLPTILTYKIFGRSDAAIRLGPLLITLISFVVFYFSLSKIFRNSLVPLITILITALLPGMIFYGKQFGPETFVLAMVLISFSLFTFHYFEKKKIYLYLFLGFLFLGGFTGWHYFLFLPPLYLFILLAADGKNTPERRVYLISMPLIAILTAGIIILHFYILGGMEAIRDFLHMYTVRGKPVYFDPFLNGRLSYLALENFNPIFLGAAGLGFFAYLWKLKKVAPFGRVNEVASLRLGLKEKPFLFMLPLMGMPILIFLFFQQWSLVHLYGLLYFSPLIGFMVAVLFTSLIKKWKEIGVGISLIVLLIGFYFTIGKLNSFYKEYNTLYEEDIQLLKKTAPQINDDYVCLGKTTTNLNASYGNIISWYLQKEIKDAPSCYEYSPEWAIFFNPALGPFYEQELNNLHNNGFVDNGCSNILCVAKRGPFVVK